MRKKRSADSLSKSVKALLRPEKSGVDSEQLLGDIIAEWGGTANLARDIKEAFLAAPSGSMVRQRFLEMVQRLIITNTLHDISKVSTPSEMTDAELDEVATHYVGKIAGASEDDDSGVDKGEEEGKEDHEGECAAKIERQLERVGPPDDWDFGD